MAVVQLVDRLQNRSIGPQLVHRLDERLHVLREAGSPVSNTGIEKGAPDSFVTADAPTDHIDVRPRPLAEPGDTVHKADPGREHRVGGVLGDFGRGDVHDQDLVPAHDEGRVEITHHIRRVLAVHTQHHPVGFHEVVDRGSLLQELRVRAHVHRMIGLGLDGIPNLRRRPNRNRALGDHDPLAVHRSADRPRGLDHVLEVGGAVFVRGSPNRDEDHSGGPHGLWNIGRETQAAGPEVTCDQHVEARLVDGNTTPLEERDLIRIDIGTDHFIASLGKASAGHETDVSGSYDCYVHGRSGLSEPSSLSGLSGVTDLIKASYAPSAASRPQSYFVRVDPRSMTSQA